MLQYDGKILHYICLWLGFYLKTNFCIVQIETCSSLFLLNTFTHSRPTCLWCVNGHFVGVRPNSMLAPGSQLEGVGGERLQVLQQIRGGRLKAHFFLKGDEENDQFLILRLIVRQACLSIRPSIHLYTRPLICSHPSNHPFS